MKKEKAPHNAARIKNRYRGETATGYEAKRVGAKKWGLEHEAVRTFIHSLPMGVIVVDIPVGTGRYAEIYAERGVNVIGFDTSPDMLKLARKQFDQHGLKKNVQSHLYEHSALDPLPNPVGWAYDAVVCTRLLNHFTLDEARQAMKNFIAAAPVVVYSLRSPKHPVTRNWHYASDVEDVIPQDGSWEREEIVIEDNDESRYCMVKLSRVG